jgi:hypothetical protein
LNGWGLQREALKGEPKSIICFQVGCTLFDSFLRINDVATEGNFITLYGCGDVFEAIFLKQPHKGLDLSVEKPSFC